MKNYLTTSLKSATTTLLLLMLVCIGSNSLLGQTVEITNPAAPGPVEYCDLEATDETFDLEIEDEFGNPVPPSQVLVQWSGPNGFASTMANPMITFNSSAQSGDYIVIVTFNGGSTVSDTLEVEITDGIDFECPDEPIRVSAGVNCMPVLMENLPVSDLDCAGNYTYCADLVVPGGTNIPLAVNVGLTEATGIDLNYSGFTVPTDLGSHEILLNIKLDGAEVFGCTVDVEVVEGLSNVACNDDINVTMDENCQAVITPDMVLEGDFCYDAFQLSIEGAAGNTSTGNSVTLTAPGTYTVTVTSNSGTCWGMITAEDKTLPEINCPTEPVVIRCSVEDQINPGTGIMDQRVVAGAVTTVPAADDDGPGCVNIPLDFSGLDGTVTGLELDFLAMIDSVQNLSIMLVSPDPDNNNGSTSMAEPDTITIADLCTVNTLCPFSNLDVSFRDFAMLPYSALGDSLLYCRSSNNFAHLGAYQPSTSFSSFNGTQVAYSTSPDDEMDDNTEGVWTLVVCNKGTTPITGIESELRMTYQSEEGILTAEDFTETTGCGNNITFTFSDEQMNSDCTDEFSKIITRTWTVTNEDSGFSSTCSHQINIERWTLDEIIFPENHDGLAFPALNCQILVNNPNLITDENIPLPELTGFPRVPFGEICDNLRITFDDEKIPVCGEYGMKVLRRFTVLDWCDSQIREHTQVIKVDQTSEIIVSCPPNMEVFSTGSQCTGEATVSEPIFTPGPNSCATDITYTVGYLYDDDGDAQTVPPSTDESFERNANITGNQEDGYVISNLPIGRTWIRYFFTDECGNTGKCTTEIDVIDETQPNPICIEFTVLALDEFGCATLPAESIDNNSYDNCGTITDFQIDDPALPGGYAPTLMYCCTSDCVDGIRTVNLRVTDDSGNSNTCQVEVEIQNNFNAVITERPRTSQQFDCTQSPINIGQLLQGYQDEFQITSNCNNSYSYELTYSNGSPVGADDMFETGECGGGNTSVKWTITDRCGLQVGTHNLSFSYTQNLDGFDVTRWPNDVTLNNCTVSLDPENLPSSQNADNIRFSTSNCNSNVAITHSDQIFPAVDDACFKILRTWTVIDWCIVNNSNLDDGRRTHVQILKVNDNIAPVMTNLNDITVPADGGSCSFFMTEAEFPIDFNISDNCTDTEDLDITFQVDGVPVSSIYNRTYEGTAGITITAVDHCGNTNTGFFRINVRDEIAPTPYCNASISTTVRAGGFAEVWTSDFDLGGTDNCDTNGLDVYFENGSTFMRWDCNDIPNGVSAQVTTEMFYEDDSGNVNSCIVTLLITDPQDHCPDGAGSIQGNIHTEEMHMIEDVLVDLMNMDDNNSMTNMATADNGNYAFDQLHYDKNYQVVPSKDDNYLNGVSTVDLVIMQRHILGIEKFDSPYKAIAADADNSGTINGIDLVTLRKLILGIITELPHDQKAWRFPYEAQQFADIDNPFPFVETLDFYDFDQSQMNQNFVAVKVGDVNADAVTSFQGGEETSRRSSKALQLQVLDRGLVPGTVADVAIKATNMEDVSGFQTTLSFNADVMKFMGVTAEGLDVTEANLGLSHLDDGYITLSWNNIEGVTVEDFRTLFTLHFDVQESGNLSEQLFLSSVLTQSEAYTGNLETMDLSLDYEGADLSNFVLYQNIPNPFSDNTEVRFNLPSATQVTFSVYDVNGRILMRNTSEYEEGNHSILLSREDLASTGVMYYKIETAFGTASRKMIQIR